MNISGKTYRALNNVFLRLCLLRRWTSDMSENKYSELAKQALNLIITFFLACEEENAGKAVNWTNFPKIAIYRAFQKAYVYFDISDNKIERIFEIGGLDLAEIPKATKTIIERETDEEFSKFICEVTKTREFWLFKGATKIATYLELVENERNFNDRYFQKSQEIVQNLKEFETIEGFKKFSNPDSSIFRMLETISRLRNQNRWTAYARTIDCSVLGHLLDTAIDAYFMSLEIEPDNEEKATKMFFIGLFHDIPEAWTKDMPSPFKDSIPGLREASELVENLMVEEHMFRILPEYTVKKLKTLIVDAGEDKQIKPYAKGADYLSASSECARQIIGGSRDFNFLRAMQDVDLKIQIGKVKLPPIANSFHNHLIRIVKEHSHNMIFY